MISIQTAKLLKSAGWEQFYCKFYHDTKLKKIAWSGDIQTAPVDFGDRYIACPSLEELLAVMPKNTVVQKCRVDMDIIYRAYIDIYQIYILHSVPSEAVALLWLKLKEKKLV